MDQQISIALYWVQKRMFKESHTWLVNNYIYEGYGS